MVIGKIHFKQKDNIFEQSATHQTCEFSYMQTARLMNATRTQCERVQAIQHFSFTAML